MLIGTLFVLCVAIVLAVSLPVSTAFAAEGEPEATVHDHNDRTWTELTADGGTLESGNYYLAGDVTLTTDITIADNATVTLCLNGYTLTGTVTNAVITFNEGVDFTLEDCSADASAPAGRGVITGGIGFLDEYTIRRGGGVYVSGNSTFTMNGGTISGNTATTGGGVGVDNDGTFIMTGGTISGNSAYDSGGGVYVVNGDTFTMTGGTISDNTAKTFGGGVDVESGTFTMTGGTISDNMATYFGSCVYKNGGTVSISGGYLDGTIDGSTVSISGGYFSEAPDAAHLAEGRGAYDIYALGGVLFDFDYIEGYPYAVYVKGVISISTEDIVYDGEAIEEGVDFMITGADGITLTYSYKTADGDEFEGLPTNAGKYTVSGYGLNGEKQFISVEFDITIAKATYDMSGITFADGNFTYDREAHSIAISGTLPSGVSVSYDVSYKVNAGEYTVTATFTGDSANYNAILDMTAKLTIAKADYDMSGVTFEGGSFTYDGQAHSLAIAGNLPYGVSVNYINNAQVNAGEHTVTAKFTGDYTNYNTIDDMTAMLTIDKAMPVYTTPENLTACIEHTLADVTLPAGWTWEDSTLSVGETGEKQFKAIFTPEDTNNYERTLVNVTLTVAEHIDENDDGICDSCGVKFRNIVTVAGGTIEGVTGSTCTVDENGSVTVVASEAPEGKEFKGWSIDGGETIISAEAAYTFTASEDTVLTAVFADKQSDVKPGGEITPETPEGLSGGAIAGIVIGSVLGALIIAYGVCALLYKKKIVKGAFFAKIYPFIKD
ncbi:MAG: InlB B-repeat-containing protein [Acutalibacteraceae bacterium]